MHDPEKPEAILSARDAVINKCKFILVLMIMCCVDVFIAFVL